MEPPSSALAASNRPSCQELADAFANDHLIRSVTREDAIEESVRVLCGVSA